MKKIVAMILTVLVVGWSKAYAGVPTSDYQMLAQQILKNTQDALSWAVAIQQAQETVKNTDGSLKGMSGLARGFASLGSLPFANNEMFQEITGKVGNIGDILAKADNIQQTMGSTMKCKDRYASGTYALQNCLNRIKSVYGDVGDIANKIEKISQQKETAAKLTANLSSATDQKGMLEAQGRIQSEILAQQVQTNALLMQQSQYDAKRIADRQLALEKELDGVDQAEARKKEREERIGAW